MEVAKRKKIAAEVGTLYGVEIADTDMCLQTINGNPASPLDTGEPKPEEEAPGGSPQESELPHITYG